MQATRKSSLNALVLKFVAIAVAAAAVYAADTLPDRESARQAHAAAPVATVQAPVLAAAGATEVWSADDSATGTRPDAAH